ncbi:MAG: stimulus-sensing domain-containing protein [Rhodospirillaceae bacterium]|nr:stimulus-sensing domain-containing protein [Rhodospirillaceae bacterium]
MRADQKFRIAPTLDDGRKRQSRALLTPLTRRILAVTLVAPVLLGLSLLFLDEYEDSLIATEIDALRTEGELIAAAIGEGAVAIENESEASGTFMPAGAARRIDPATARQLIRRLAALASVRARLYDRGGSMIADSRLLRGPGGEVRVVDLPPADNGRVAEMLRQALAWVEGTIGTDARLEPYIEQVNGTAYDFAEVIAAIEQGEAGNAVRIDRGGHKVLTVAVPVQFYKQVAGAVLVSDGDANLEQRLFEVRSAILTIFVWTCVVTVLLSLYLASTIARPIRRLAEAATRVRESLSRQHDIPDLSRRGDEIGALSSALRDMTEGLWLRMDATEQFAADVAHEIKNPLTSLRSAVETVARVQDPEQQKRLMSIIQDDVTRLDRLISDISDASRLDAELSRAETETVDISKLLVTLAQMTNSDNKAGAPLVEVDVPLADDLSVLGLEGRLAQVFRNLIGNAVSFSPPEGKITVRADRHDGAVRVVVEDQGPGIPKGKESKIFSRFYSERPEKEKFGTHSGLGLSISKQIIDAHRGTIDAENTNGGGARFVVRLPGH